MDKIRPSYPAPTFPKQLEAQIGRKACRHRSRFRQCLSAQHRRLCAFDLQRPKAWSCHQNWLALLLGATWCDCTSDHRQTRIPPRKPTWRSAALHSMHQKRSESLSFRWGCLHSQTCACWHPSCNKQAWSPMNTPQCPGSAPRLQSPCSNLSPQRTNRLVQDEQLRN